MGYILDVKNINVKIKGKKILNDISFQIEKGRIYSVIGPNGSGKTTLIRTLSRNIKPEKGDVLLEGRSIFKTKTKTIAKKMAVLSQVKNSQADVTVRNLISYGRYAHKQWWEGFDKNDKDIIEWAINRTGIKELKNRKLASLSGGERQRAWIAMAIAQKPDILLLDEPTTFLDICHQIELLELIKGLNIEYGLTVIMVVHDINHAARYSENILVMQNGKLYKKGCTLEVLEEEMIESVFRIKARITKDELTGKPIFYPEKVV